MITACIRLLLNRLTPIDYCLYKVDVAFCPSLESGNATGCQMPYRMWHASGCLEVKNSAKETDVTISASLTSSKVHRPLSVPEIGIVDQVDHHGHIATLVRIFIYGHFTLSDRWNKNTCFTKFCLCSLNSTCNT